MTKKDKHGQIKKYYLRPSGLNAKALIGPKCPLTPPISSCKI
jgi:hypothetical protein